MMWRVVASFAPSLSEEFRNAHENLVKVLTGSKRSEDLWKRCMGDTDDAIGMALGSLFIEKAFEGSSKQQVRNQTLGRRQVSKKMIFSLLHHLCFSTRIPGTD